MKKKKNDLPDPKHPLPQRSAPGLKFQPPNGMPLADDQPNAVPDFGTPNGQ